MMDFIDMGVNNQKEGKRYILVVEDHFSRWVEAVATANQDVLTMAKFLCREVISQFGVPDFLSSDNGRHFVNLAIEAVAKALCMEHKLGCVYHSQSQGMVERANRTIKQKVTKIRKSSKLNWVQALPLALMKNHITHLTPLEMLTGCPIQGKEDSYTPLKEGRKTTHPPDLPWSSPENGGIDFESDSDPQQGRSHRTWAETWKRTERQARPQVTSADSSLLSSLSSDVRVPDPLTTPRDDSFPAQVTIPEPAGIPEFTHICRTKK